MSGNQDLKSPQDIAEEKYPGKTKKAGSHGALVREQREAFIAGMQEGEKDAIEFAEWCEMQYWQIEKGIWVKDLDEPKTKRFTTEQLYNLFKQEK